MKVALICPSNRLFMPYVGTYERLLKEQGIDYDIINWNRCHMEESTDYTFQDNKCGHARSFLDYLKFRTFIVQTLKAQQYDKVVIFGIQLAFFLQRTVRKAYKYHYVFDIRDYHSLHKLFSFKSFMKQAALVVISSPAYTRWLKRTKKYMINHNINTESIRNIESVSCSNDNQHLVVANIGATRDLDMNIDFINALKNTDSARLTYHGEGPINAKLEAHVKKQAMLNVVITGKYEAHEETALYEQSDFINVLRYNDHINNETALPNRLYNALLHGKPLLAYEGTYVADIIDRFRLGLVLRSFDDVEQQLHRYIETFDETSYNEGRCAYLQQVLIENEQFEQAFKTFLRS